MQQPRWRDLTHQQVFDLVHAGPGPTASEGARAAWDSVEAALRKIDGDLAAAMRAAGWEGAAADAAHDGLTPLGRWAVAAAQSAGRAALSVQEHQDQVAYVRSNMPPPGDPVSEDPPANLQDPGIDPFNQQAWAEQSAANAAVAEQAFHVMDNYATNTGLIQHWVPAWTPPPTVTVALAGPGTAGSPVPPVRRRSSGSPVVAPASAVRCR